MSKSSDNSHEALSTAKRKLLEKRLKGRLGATRKRNDGLLKRPAEEAPLASPGQQRLWLLHEAHPDSTNYHISQYLTFREESIDLELVKQSMDEILERHQVLRTTFRLKQGQLLQVVHDAMTCEIESINADDNSALKEAVSNRLLLPFDLETGPLFRVVAGRSGKATVLGFSFHHIVFDEWSAGIFFKELGAIYSAGSEGEKHELSVPEFNYTDYAHTQIQNAALPEQSKQLAYWKERLKNPPGPLTLATDRPYPAELTETGSIEQIRLEGDDAKALKKWAISGGSSAFPGFLLAFEVLLGIYGHSSDILIGTPVANRRYKETGEMIGFFLNTLCLRNDLSANPTAIEALEQTRKAYLEAMSNQDIPFDSVLQEIEFERVPGRHPLIQHMFVYQQEADVTPEVTLGKAKAQPKWIEAGQSKFDLTLFVVEGSDHFDLMIEYRTCLFEAASIRRMLLRYAVILKELSSRPEASVGEINYMTGEDIRQLEAFSRGPEMPDSADSVLHGLFHPPSGQVGDSPALIEAGITLTYSDMQSRIETLARAILQDSEHAEGPVGIHIPRSAAAIIALLAVQRLGRAYLPLDPDYPQKRIRFMIEDSGVNLVISTRDLASTLGEIPSARITTEEELTDAPDQNPGLPEFTPDGTAYIIYTSGSSGIPKGVPVPFRQLQHSTLARAHYYTDSPGRFLLIPSLSFDSSVAGIFWTLSTSGSLCLPDRATIQDPEELGAFIEKNHVESLLCVPTYYREILRLNHTALRSLRTVIVAGESCPRSLIEAHFEKLPDCRLYNEYGPTEATVWSTVHAFSKSDARAEGNPIGKPIPNTVIQLIDSIGRRMAPGLPGEICIAGPGVTEGYHNRPEATEKSFFKDRVLGHTYRSGDLGVWDQHGSLHFLGRLDDQVKIRGYRIETGEVEEAIQSHPDVGAAAVIVVDSGNSPRRLVGFVASEAGDAEWLARDIPEYLSVRLPDYMIPSRIIGLPDLPRLPNGKVNRRALTESLDHSSEAPAMESGTGPFEDNPKGRILIKILQELLGLQGIRPEDNFFSMGGDSILAIQAVSKAREAGLTMTVGQFLSSGSIGALAHTVAPPVEEQLLNDEPVGPLPLTPIQEWFLQNPSIRHDHWNLSVILDVHTEISSVHLENCIRELLKHHDALRIAAKKVHSGWKQEILPFSENLLHMEVFSCPDDKDDCQQLVESTAERLQSSTRLAEGKLVKGAVFERNGQQPNQLLLIVHHMAVDWVSWKILLEDLKRLIQQIQADQPLTFLSKSISFRKWAQSLVEISQGPRLDSEIPFWKAQAYNKCQRIPLETGTLEDNLEGSEEVLALTFSPAETDRIQESARKLGITVQAILYGGLARSIASWSGGKAVLVDLEGHGREGSICPLDTTRTVGWFTSQFPVVLQLGEFENDPPYYRFIQAQLEEIPNRGMGFGVLKYLGEQDSGIASIPEPEITLNYLGKRQTDSESGLISTKDWSIGGDRDKRSQRTAVLEVNAYLSPDELVANFSYSRNLHKDETIARLLDNTRSCILEAAKDILGEAPSEPVFPLTDVQSTLLAHHLLSREEDLGLIQLKVSLSGPISAKLVQKAWTHLLKIYPVLRTTIHWENRSAPVQKVNSFLEWDIDLKDFSGESDSVLFERVESLLQADASEPLEISKGPSFRLSLIKTSDTAAILVWTCHHILLDGWSSGLVLQTFVQSYNRLLQELEVENKATAPFQRYCDWLASRPQTAPSVFWKSRFRGLKKSPLLSDQIMASSIKGRPKSISHTESVHLEVLENGTLESMARECRVSPFAILLSAWTILLSELIGTNKVVTGVTVSGRNDRVPGEAEMAGMLANTIPVIADLDSSSPFRNSCQQFFSELQEYRNFDYCSEKQIYQWTGLPRTKPLFDCLFIFANQPIDKPSLDDSEILKITDIEGAFTSAYPLTVIFRNWDSFIVDVVVDRSIFDSQLAAYITTRLKQLFQQIRTSLDKPLKEIREASHPFKIAQQVETGPSEEILKGGTQPQGQTEEVVQSVWQSVFDVDSIGIDADFFEIGGNSLLATHLIAQLQDELKRPMPIDTLFRAPTIRSFAQQIERQRNHSNLARGDSSLVPINPSGDRIPLVMIHPLDGDVFQYHLLGKHIPANQPLYAIQAPEKTFSSMDEMSEAYLNLVFEQFPDGRFILGGYCFGAGVAFEILQKMAKRELPMYPLLAIDFMYISLVRYRPAYLIKLLREETLQSFMMRLRGWEGKLRNKVRRKFKSKDSALKPVIEDYFELPELPDTTREQIESHFFMLNARKPKPFYGDVALVLSDSVYSRNDKWVGWDRFTKGRLVREIVDVEHTLMMESEEIYKVAEAILKILDPINRDNQLRNNPSANN